MEESVKLNILDDDGKAAPYGVITPSCDPKEVHPSGSRGLSASSSGEHSHTVDIKNETVKVDSKHKRRIHGAPSSIESKTVIKREPSSAASGIPLTPLGTATTSRGGRGNDTYVERPCQEHSFLTNVEQVRQMEQGLLQLLDDFHSGHLQAFSDDSVFYKMDQVREQQERLARLHFELDTKAEISQGNKDEEAREEANKNLANLMSNLTELCTSIESVQEIQNEEKQKEHT